MNIAALIIGIDGWEQYTAPLIESLAEHEPECTIITIDNASANPYPLIPGIVRTERLCYSAAINIAHSLAFQMVSGYPPQNNIFDWYIVLSNDVLCTGPFVHMLEQMQTNCIVGPCLKETHGYQYLEGWCVCVPNVVWDVLGGWEENFLVSSWEDVDFSQTALERGYDVLHAPELPFVHLDQRQRFTLVSNYWDSERHNITYFSERRRHANAAYGR